MARPSLKTERKAQIIHAMMRVMARRGYEGASIAEVARVARLTPGLVHHYFRDKREILVTLIDVAARAAHVREGQWIERAGDDPRAKLHAFVRAHLAIDRDSDEDAVACWIEIAAEAWRSSDVRKQFAGFLTDELELLRSLVRDALPRAASRHSQRIAAAILAAIHGYFTTSGIAPKLIPRGSAAGAVVSMTDGLLEDARRGRFV